MNLRNRIMVDMPRLVLIEWLDSRQPMPGWQRLSHLEEQSASRCVSVGFLVREDAQSKVIAPNLNSSEGDGAWDQASGLMTIPTASITKMKTVSALHLSIATPAAAEKDKPLADAQWLRRLA